MKENNKSLERYTRTQYTVAEQIYKAHMEMRKNIYGLENLKYEMKDPYSSSEEFKQGYLAGVKTMMSIFMDL